MWRDYFHRGTINGVDISPDAALQEDERNRIRVFIGSQSDTDFLENMIDEIGHLDVVIDDGSHLGRDQITTLLALWPFVKPGGWYTSRTSSIAHTKSGSSAFGNTQCCFNHGLISFFLTSAARTRG